MRGHQWEGNVNRASAFLDDHQTAVIWLIVCCMCATAIAAIAVPWNADDEHGTATEEGVFRLKNQARLMANSIPGWLVVDHIEMVSSNPDSGTGTVDVLGPFGVKAGSIHIEERSSHSDVDLGTLALSWVALVAIELVFSVVLVRTMIRS